MEVSAKLILKMQYLPKQKLIGWDFQMLIPKGLFITKQIFLNVKLKIQNLIMQYLP